MEAEKNGTGQRAEKDLPSNGGSMPSYKFHCPTENINRNKLVSMDTTELRCMECRKHGIVTDMTKVEQVRIPKHKRTNIVA